MKIVYTLKDTFVYYLSMAQPPHFSPALPLGFWVEPIERPISVQYYKYLMDAVGREWHWLDRMVMPEPELADLIHLPETTVFVLKNRDNPAGLFELTRIGEISEIYYFGLLPQFVGQGLGKQFLKWCINKAWEGSTQKVILNTCSLDHVAALPLYLAHGFVLDKTETEARKVRV